MWALSGAPRYRGVEVGGAIAQQSRRQQERVPSELSARQAHHGTAHASKQCSIDCWAADLATAPSQPATPGQTGKSSISLSSSAPSPTITLKIDRILLEDKSAQSGSLPAANRSPKMSRQGAAAAAALLLVLVVLLPGATRAYEFDMVGAAATQ